MDRMDHRFLWSVFFSRGMTDDEKRSSVPPGLSVLTLAFVFATVRPGLWTHTDSGGRPKSGKRQRASERGPVGGIDAKSLQGSGPRAQRDVAGGARAGAAGVTGGAEAPRWLK